VTRHAPVPTLCPDCERELRARVDACDLRDRPLVTIGFHAAHCRVAARVAVKRGRIVGWCLIAPMTREAAEAHFATADVLLGGGGGESDGRAH